MESKKVVIAKAKNSEDYNRLCSIANKYIETSSIKAWGGVDSDAQFFPNDEYDLIHITEMLKEKGFEYVVEEAI
ncbi:MAG: hypothetical protein U0J38_00670 [Bacteroidales bacterium]|nr:hypothetical protein [Bacteroidales bacterium]